MFQEKDQLAFPGMDEAEPTAAEFRDEGMDAAEEHTEEIDPGWTARAIQFIKDYAVIHREAFQIYDVQLYAEALGFPPPASIRAWGPAAVKAKKAGVIKSAGLTYSKNPRAHNTPVGAWIRTW